jgi:hypothetical protein
MWFPYRSLLALAPLVALPLALSLAIPVGCATSASSANAAKYPRRGGNCRIRVFHTPVPDVKEWDDLGMAHVECQLDVGGVQCLRRLREEACRMGGDLLYDVPKKPMRPTEQGMVYAGHVAHTKERADDGGSKDSDDAGAGEGDQPEGQSSGPVQPVEPIAPISPSTPSAPNAPNVPLVPVSPLSRGPVDAGRPGDGASAK